MKTKGYSKDIRGLKWWFIALVIFNAWDALATWYWVRAGVAIELNPIMSWCLDQGDWTFFLAKASIMVPIAAVWWYPKITNRPAPIPTWAYRMIQGLTIVYGLVGIWHLINSI